jgi:hypothetical protein
MEKLFGIINGAQFNLLHCQLCSGRRAAADGTIINPI